LSCCSTRSRWSLPRGGSEKPARSLRKKQRWWKPEKCWQTLPRRQRQEQALQCPQKRCLKRTARCRSRQKHLAQRGRGEGGCCAVQVSIKYVWRLSVVMLFSWW
jgi:hypothetical protein